VVAEAYRVMGLRESVLEALLVAAEVSVRRGDHDEALALLDLELGSGEEPALLRPAISLVRAGALLGLGRTAQAHEVVNAGLATAREQGLLFEEALLRWARADLAAEPSADDRAGAERILASLGVTQLAPAGVATGAR
jgi:hypothetical protein